MSAIFKCGCLKLIPFCLGSAILSGAFAGAGASEENENGRDPVPQDEVVLTDSNPAQDVPVTYSVRISKDADRIKLKGSISSEEDYKTLIGMVKANFPSMTLSDRVKIEPETPVPDVKIGGLSFALKVLGYVENGSATYDNNGLMLEGSVNTAVVLEQVQQLVEREKPEGISVRKLRVSAPDMSWRVQLNESNTIKISGIIPDTEKKDEVLGKLRHLFPAHTIIDNSKIAADLPQHWNESVDKSIELLAYMNSGLVDVTKTSINVKGHAGDKARLNLLIQATKEMPDTVAVNSEVTAPERTTVVDVIGGASTLSATVPAFTTDVE
jgi:RNA binding exosome subunit